MQADATVLPKRQLSDDADAIPAVVLTDAAGTTISNPKSPPDDVLNSSTFPSSLLNGTVAGPANRPDAVPALLKTPSQRTSSSSSELSIEFLLPGVPRPEDSNRITLPSPAPFPCTLCPKGFESVSDLKRHQKNIHENPKRFPCPHCTRTFRASTTRESHIAKAHSGKKSAEFPCHICNKVLVTASSLKTHMVVHSDARPFVCTVCAKTFRHACARKLHMRLHSGEKPYTCCNQMFRYLSSLAHHRRTRHGGQAPEPQPSPPPNPPSSET
ncbi:unnamed protein product (mitochondrion) [Plasmodiophora brassicae]|uniref:C2H2-type domain-containing protein n=1 Tax=Plasmodiophora brassicae TaxID=37360 RepID=A0A0G4IQP5_PLABS|nr:hypothetical protein PBRA_000901 [Plasmodiophora brassicae]SPQ97860.1 unnamed protein product [Plasmodiophora brassicae]